MAQSSSQVCSDVRRYLALASTTTPPPYAVSDKSSCQVSIGMCNFYYAILSPLPLN